MTEPRKPWTGRRAVSNVGAEETTSHEGRIVAGDNRTDGRAERGR